MDHPCGNLPLRQCHVFVWACECCGAVWADVSVCEQQSEDVLLRSQKAVQFGPFDTAEDVSAVVCDLTRRHVVETIRGTCRVEGTL